MFRKLAGFAVVASLLFAGAAFAQTGNMANTGHDFGNAAGFDNDAWNVANGLRTCNVCHTPSGATQLCLSCHDGTLGLDSFGGNRNNSTNQLTAASSAYVGTDLRDDHPVSVTYGGVSAGLHGSPTATETQLFAGNVECASCHEPHNEGNFGSMLVMDPSGSALCNSCHNK